MMKLVYFILLAATGVARLASAANATGEMTIDEIVLANESGNLTSLKAAFETSQLLDVLCTDCNYTVFAPVDAAFAAIEEDRLNNLLEKEGYIVHLQQLLALHVTRPTADRVLLADLTDGMMLETLTSDMENLTVSVGGMGAGTVVTISSPDTAASTVVSADNIASNGNIHLVDQVLLPEWWEVDIFGLRNLSRASDFSLVFELIDLVGVGKYEISELTILAPTDEAIRALGEDKLAEWRNGENMDVLGTILLNHVLNSLYPSVLIEDGAKAQTFGNSEVTFTKSDDGTMISVNGANVVQKDVLASNAIVHVIDKVILPDAESPATTAPDGPTSPNAAPTGSAPDGPTSPTVAPAEKSAGNVVGTAFVMLSVLSICAHHVVG